MNLRTFSLRIFQHCPLTSHCGPDILEKAYAHWIGYKKRIPVRGAILLNEAMDSVLLVRGYYKGAAWMFPRGKINQAEDDLDCAIREVYEETGFNAREAGLIPENRNLKSFEMSIRDQHVKLFVIPNVPMDTHFEPRTRKEIGKIQWYRLADLPGRSKKKQGQDNTPSGIPNANKFYMVASFLEQLNRWIKQQLKRRDRSRHIHKHTPLGQLEIEDIMTEEEGMATETAAEPPPVFATVESHEAATRELHRLLKIQPPTQRSQAGVSDPGQDKGQALLAMLQQNQHVPQQTQPMFHPGSRVPHTPMDNMYNIAPEPETSHHHHPTQMLPSDHLHTPPRFPTQADMNDQLRSVLGLAGNPSIYPMQQPIQVSSQQLTMTTASGNMTQSNLLHPQPLPRQANNILADATTPTPVSYNKHAQVSHQTNAPGSFVGSINLPQQLVANFRQPPATLDNTRLALLNAFKKDVGLTNDVTPRTSSPQRPVQESHGPNQQPFVNFPAQNGPQNMPMAPDGNTQASTTLRTPSVSQTQQKALLDIFKQPSAMSPTQRHVQPNLKENGSPHPSSLQQGLPGFQADFGPIPPIPINQTDDRLMHTSQGRSLPYGAQSIATHLTHSDQTVYQRQQTPQAAAKLFSGLTIDGVGVENKTKVLGSPSRAPGNNLLGSPYSNHAQLGLATSPGSMASIPNLAPRRQEADPQQLQKLMSLFSKSATTVPTNTLAGNGPTIKGKETAFHGAEQAPTPGSHVPMAASPSIDKLGGAPSMSRRGSQQAPISPENEKFLLNYLKTVSSGAK